MVISEDYYTATLLFLGTFLVSYSVVWWRRSRQSQQRIPPCLPSLPILGSIPFLSNFDELHVHFTEKAAVVGKVFSLKLGDMYTVVLNGRAAINEAFVKRSLDFSSRPTFYLNAMFNAKRKGIVEHPYNPQFKRVHHLALSILKRFGFGQGIMERRIKVEVEELINQFRKLNDEAFDPAQVITASVSNVIASIIFGKRFELCDPELEKIIAVFRQMLGNVKDSMTLNCFPFFKFLPKYKKALSRCYELDDAWSAILQREINKSLSGGTDESFVSCFAQEDGPEYDHELLLFIVRDLFLAGTETTATSLRWMLILMANHPEVQSLVQKEIDEVVPKSRLPSLDDKSRLPYVEATILELMRIRTILPLALPHTTTNDTEIGGYFIPANCLVFANLYSLHMDPEIWPEPEKFRPERFIDESGRIINKELVIPFSLGKRSCLGEMLARQELFLFTTSLIQQFDIRPPEGQQTINVHNVVGVTVAPSPFQVRLIKRTQH